MKLASVPSAAEVPVGEAAPSVAAWRAQYWKLRGRGRKVLREAAVERCLRNLPPSGRAANGINRARSRSMVSHLLR